MRKTKKINLNVVEFQPLDLQRAKAMVVFLDRVDGVDLNTDMIRVLCNVVKFNDVKVERLAVFSKMDFLKVKKLVTGLIERGYLEYHDDEFSAGVNVIYTAKGLLMVRFLGG